MKVIFSCALLSSILAINAFSQQATPTPTPRPADEDVVKISTNLVQIDVTVTNRDGKVIRDLKPEEVEIYQNGKKQDISNFSFISNAREIKEGEAQAKPKQKPGEVVIPPPSPIKATNVKRTIALVVDDLSLSWTSTYSVQRALRKFVDEQMQDGDLVAVIRTGAGIGALQQFTNDKRQLYAAIDKIRYNAVGTGKVSSFDPLQGKGEIEESLPISPDAQQRADDQFRASMFATGTLGALGYVVRGMADLPGRKSIMLLSDGFALYTQDADGNRDQTRVHDAIKALADRANRASVVIYTMDARGLVTTGLTAADDVGARSPEEQRKVESDRISDVLDSQQGLKFLAMETGGRAIINNNDLSNGIRKILDDQSYYLLGYVPDDETFNATAAHFNNLVVKVTRPGVVVRYRSGFFGVVDQKRELTAKSKTVNRIEEALTSPFAVNDIPIHLNALFGSSTRDGSYIRSLVHVQVKDLTFMDEPNGGKKVSFDIIAVAFGDNGNAVEHLYQSFTAHVKKEDYDDAIKIGFTKEVIFPVKKPGAYQLRVAFRDKGSDKVGSANQFVEVPDLKKNRLTLSSVAVENISMATWQKRREGDKKAADEDSGNAMSDTAMRQFKRGSVLNYGMSIYNAKSAPANLTSQIKLYRDGKPFFEGKVVPVTPSRANDSRAVGFTGSLKLGTEMEAGDYVMEIIVTDGPASEKPRTAVQFVQFEMVE